MTTEAELEAPTVAGLTADMLETSAYWGAETFPLKAHLYAAHPKVLFVAGPNASGKSYFVEFLRAWFKNRVDRSTTISISIRERVGGGQGDMAGMRKVMIFGDESVQSTGATSAKVIQRAFENLPSRAEQGYRTLLVLDEPEMGLSEGFSEAMGEFIGMSALEMPAKTAALVVVSHSRQLAAALARTLGQYPSFVHMQQAVSFEQWLTQPEPRTVAQLLALAETGFATKRAIWAFEKELKASQGEQPG